MGWELIDIMTQMDLIGIYRTFHPNRKFIFSSQHVIEPSLKLITYLVIKQQKQNKCNNLLLRLKIEFNNNTNYRKHTKPQKLNNS